MRDMRGRSGNSSPMISCQGASTSCAFVKKRWPPRSNRKPSISTVFARPPPCRSASSTTALWPALPSTYAAVSPAGPAPRTNVVSSILMRLSTAHVYDRLEGLPEVAFGQDLVGRDRPDAPEARIGGDRARPGLRGEVDLARPARLPGAVVAEDGRHDDEPLSRPHRREHRLQVAGDRDGAQALERA